MIKTLWFIIKTGFIIAATVWFVKNPGYVRLDWLDYTITAHIGLVFLVTILFLWVFSYVAGFWSFIINFPSIWRRYKTVNGSVDGMDFLSKGYAALAAGNSDAALKNAKKARSFFPDTINQSLVDLLEMQAARDTGNTRKRNEAMKRLMEYEDQSILGLRGQIRDYLEEGKIEESLELVREKLKNAKNKESFREIYYQLSISAGRWTDALSVLEKMKPSSRMPRERIKSDKAALMTVTGIEKRQSGSLQEAREKLGNAVSIDEGFIPAARELASLYIKDGRIQPAKRLLKKAWRTNPHPDYVRLWESLMPTDKGKGGRHSEGGHLKWLKGMVDNTDTSAEAQEALAHAAIEDGLWGQAKSYLQKLEETAPSRNLYRLWIELERQSGNDFQKIGSLMEKSAQAPYGKTWVCRETGRTYADWEPVAKPHGSFNTIIWADPENLIFLQNHAISLRNTMIDKYLPRQVTES